MHYKEIADLVIDVLYHTDGPVDDAMEWHQSFMTKIQARKYRLTITKFSLDSEIYSVSEVRPKVERYLKAGAPTVQDCLNGKLCQVPATIY